MKTSDGYELCLVDTEYDEAFHIGADLINYHKCFLVLDEPQGLEWWDNLTNTMTYSLKIVRDYKTHSLLFVEKSEEVKDIFEDSLGDWEALLCLARLNTTDVMVCTTKKELGYFKSTDLFMACILHNLYAFMDGYVETLSPLEMVCLYYGEKEE